MAKLSVIEQRRAAVEADPVAYEARRKEIADAAVRVFDRLGFQKATISAVAQEMKVDRSTLYYYISSKEELFDEVVRTVVERNLQLVRRIAESKVQPRRKLRDMITSVMSSYGEHYPLFYIYIRENLSHVSDERSEWSQQMREMNRETTEAMIAVIEEGFADGSFRKVGSARVVAYGIFGIIGWTHRWFRPASSEVSAEEIGKTYAEMILSGLESPY
ncbi:MAG: TetR/AcrR family transcriptional regulator [Novosphingobium sp.]|uniref:TetR/AcrR family transcriptional regulator n=1 Tax=Tsuneonella sp. CC-YZS046 TaxID=3042152 RepID=UPI002D79FDED|nr:TetR/AcrR family transcriptional regulator [Tsuneonella sp. CC-YZS046]WRO66747.1 TetR/AcrR family transcriptional regulator [Tsuneonella sp. CC-YZS046]